MNISNWFGALVLLFCITRIDCQLEIIGYYAGYAAWTIGTYVVENAATAATVAAGLGVYHHLTGGKRDAGPTIASPQTVASPQPTCSLNSWWQQDLQFSLSQNLVGQHLASQYAMNALKAHILSQDPDQALSIVFAGTTGVGKNFISTIISNSLFGKNYKRFVRTYSGRADFPKSSMIHEYRERLFKEVAEYVKVCPHSVFIFDEIDKMPFGIIDVLKPYLDFHQFYNGVSYSNAIFIFLTNIGGKDINTAYRKIKKSGIVRDDMKYAQFEPVMRRALFESGGMFEGASLIENHLISFYLPFLPLEKEHVKTCIRNEMKKSGMNSENYKGEKVITNVLEKMEFAEGDYSLTGCKRVRKLVSLEKYS